MTVQRQAHGDGFFSFRKLRLVVRANGKTVVDRLLCGELRCSPGSHHSLALQNVWGGVAAGGGPERLHRRRTLLLRDADRARRRSVPAAGSSTTTGATPGTRAPATTASTSSSRRTTASPTSSRPSRPPGCPRSVLTIDPSARFADITPHRLDLVRTDAKQWWHAYVQFRGKPDGDIRGVLAAGAPTSTGSAGRRLPAPSSRRALRQRLAREAGRPLAGGRQVHRARSTGTCGSGATAAEGRRRRRLGATSGGRSCASLRADGHEVVARLPATRPASTMVSWDTAGSAVDGADAVVNLAGASIGGPRWTRGRKEAIARAASRRRARSCRRSRLAQHAAARARHRVGDRLRRRRGR